MIKAINISKKYKSHLVFDNFSYEFNKGLYIVKGENGAGKSTLLKILAGIIQHEGAVTRDETFYLPEKLDLPKTLSIIDVFKLFDIHNYDELMARYKIPKCPLYKMSKGMLQKLGIVISLLTNTNNILYDEPLEGLDSDSQMLFFEDILKIKDTKTIIMVLHDIPLNLDYDILINIKDGKIC